jgi:glycosyltransferase involved in cell wall biosynthesis
MRTPNSSRIVVLANVWDENYFTLRAEKIDRSLGAKRQVLWRCLELASGRDLIVLSAPPKAVERRTGKWLPTVETKFATHQQFFCCNWDVPKLRILLSWFFYARQVLRRVRSGDVVVIDNYEFIYVVAAWFLRIFRRVTFILDYEDGKHLIDRSWSRMLSGLAEAFGRPLIRAAMLAHPALAKRLPASIPMELVPGFVPEKIPLKERAAGQEVCFLYSGTLDRTRGVDLLLESLNLLPDHGWRLDITGHGPLTDHVARVAQEPRWRDRVKFRESLPLESYERVVAASHVGLNCQRASDPISGVTFPSKVFTYLSAGLLVISSKAGCVEQICGNACWYYEEETPQSLGAAMKEVIEHFPAVREKLDLSEVYERYSVEATTVRLKRLLNAIGV